MLAQMDERCSICNCRLHRGAGTYASPTIEGRSHATSHHFVAERFFGRSGNRKGVTKRLFEECPWGKEKASALFCYECHEELLHNPILLPEDISRFAELIRLRGLEEREKGLSTDKHAARIQLFHEAIARGLESILRQEQQNAS